MLRILILFTVCILHTISSWCQEVAVTTHDVKCNGGSDGEISVNITNSSGEYILRILHASNNKQVALNKLKHDTSLVFTGLKANKYVVQIVSETGQKVQGCVIEQPEPLTANIIEIVKKPSSENNCNGVVKALPTGGTPPYDYKWSENAGYQSSAKVVDLCKGIYKCIITDVYKCNKVSATVYLH